MGIRPVVRAIALVMTVFFAGCSGMMGGESGTEAKPAAKKTSASAKSVVRDNTIVPGKRIGPVSVGMPVSQLYDVMGEPTQTQKGRGIERYVFEGLEVVVDDTDESVSTVTTAVGGLCHRGWPQGRTYGPRRQGKAGEAVRAAVDQGRRGNDDLFHLGHGGSGLEWPGEIDHRPTGFRCLERLTPGSVARRMRGQPHVRRS